MTTIEQSTITTAGIIDWLTDAVLALADVPGRTPQDGQIAQALLTYVVASIHGTPNSRLLLNTLERRGVDRHEAQEVALALHGLALRLGAWLGRDAKACQDVPGAREGARSIDTTGMAENGAQRVRR